MGKVFRNLVSSGTVAIAFALLLVACAEPTNDAVPPTSDVAQDAEVATPTAEPVADSQTSQLSRQFSSGQCEGDGPVTFGTSPMRLQDIGNIVPLGLMIGAHVTPIDHVYFSPLEFDSDPFRYDVRAPADGYIVGVEERTNFVGDDAVPLERAEYRVTIEYSCSFYTIYDLITRLAPDVDAAYVESGERRQTMRFPVFGGQVIGKIGGQTLDLNVVDLDITLSGFVVPAHYEREPWKIHSVAPFDYFEEPLRSRLLELNPRLAEPRGGRIDYDIPGKLVGSWFLEGTEGYGGTDQQRYWSGHLSFAYDHYDPTQVRVSIGDVAGKSEQFGVLGNGPDPAAVTVADGVVRYDFVDWEYFQADSGDRWDRMSRANGLTARNGNHVQAAMLAQVLDGDRIRVEVLPGGPAAEAQEFTDQVRIYER